MPDLLDVLRRLETLEGAMCSLYDWYATLFAEDREVAAFFARLSDEEGGHANLARFQGNLVSKNRPMRNQVEVDLADIDRVQREVDTFRNRRVPPTLREALVFAMLQESRHAEQLTRGILSRAGSDLAPFIQNLAGRDQDHLQRLVDLALSRRIPLPPELGLS